MGLTATTTNLSYARNELIKVGASFTFDKVADMIYYMLANDDVSTTSTAVLKIGTFGTPLTVTQTANYPLGIFGDISTAQSSGSTVQRAVWARLKVSSSQTSPASIFGGQLQLRWADGATTLGSGTENAQYGGAWLYLEQDTASQALADYAHASGAVVQVETVGALTIPTNAHLSGVQIESRLGASDSASISLNSGTIAGLFITKSPAASGVTAQDWPYGIFIEDCTVGIQCNETLVVGVDGTGHDVTFYGDSSGSDIEWDANTNSLDFTNSKLEILTTDDKIAAFNAVYSYVDTGGSTGWTSGNVVAGRFKINIDGTTSAGDATALWAGLVWAGSVARNGLAVAMNVELTTTAGNNAPNAILYIQSLPGTNGDHSGLPYIVFTETATGTGSNILFECGHVPAGTTVTSGSGKLFNTTTLQIKVNGTAKYIPLSTTENTLTTAGNVALTGTLTTGVNQTGVDVKFFGDSDGVYMEWDADDDRLEIVNGFVTLGLFGTGIPVNNTIKYALEVHTEPGIALTATGLSAGIRSRYEISFAQTNQVTFCAVDARLRVKAAMADGVHSGIQGYIEADDSIAFTGTSTTQRNAGTFTVEMGTGCTISAGWVTGVMIDSSVHSAVNMSSCIFAGLAVKISSSKEIWQHGIYIDTDAATTGITVKGGTTTGIDFSNGGATGIDFDGTWTASCIQVGDNSTPLTTALTSLKALTIYADTTATSGAHDCLYIDSTSSGAGSCSARGIYSRVEITGNLETNSSWVSCIYARLELENMTVNHAGACVQAMDIRIEDTSNAATMTAFDEFSVASFQSMQLGGDVSAKHSQIIRLANNGTVTWNAFMACHGNEKVKYMFRYSGCGGGTPMLSQAPLGASHGGETWKIKIRHEDISTDLYILASTTPT